MQIGAASFRQAVLSSGTNSLANDQLFKQLLQGSVMTIGWHLAQADSRDDFVRDPVGNADFASDLTDRLRYLVEQVASHRYRPRHLIEVDIPKSGLSVRPGNVLPIEEAALLHAIVYVLAPRLDKLLSDGVFSYRLHKDWKKKAKKGESMFKEGDVQFPFLKRKTINKFSPFEAWYNQWPEFEAASKRAVTEEGFTHLTKTDISAYFENVDLRLLMDQIRSRMRQQESRILQLLFRILDGWRRTTSAGFPLDRGIPQGNEVSSFLGNLYLIPLDDALTAFCKSRDAKWFRYVDDVKVFTKTPEHAREAVFAINEALRALHLNLQGSKTKILSGVDLERELDTAERDKISSAKDEILRAKKAKPADSKQITRSLKSISPICRRFTNGVPESVRKLQGEEGRLFRMILTTYGIAGRSRRGLPEAALHAIRELPDLRVLRSCLRYLCCLPYEDHQWVLDELFNMLDSGELLFPYQAGTVLEAMVDLHPEDLKNMGSKVRTYSFGPGLQRKHDWLVFAKGLEALSSFPYKDKYFDTITARYIQHSHPVVRRAAVAAVARCKKDVVRERTAGLIRHPDSGVSRMAIWLQRLYEDREFVKEEFSRMRKSGLSDHSVVLRLPMLYAASATVDPEIAKQVIATIDKLRTKSRKVEWHIRHVRERAEPVTTP